MTEILLKQAMVGIVGSIGAPLAVLPVVEHPRQAVQPFSRCGEIPFCNRRIYGNRRQIEPAGIVHRGEFVFTKEATSRLVSATCTA